MYAHFTETKKGTWAYIQKSTRIDGKVTTLTLKRLGLLSDIQKEHGCVDPRQWVVDLAERMTREEREGRGAVSLDFYPSKKMESGSRPLRHGGDLMLIPLYNRLGLREICKEISKGSRAKYDLNEILRTLVTSRLLHPASKAKTFDLAGEMVKPPKFGEHDMYRALSLLAGHIDDIQAKVYRNSCGIVKRRTRVIYYDCTNYFFEIEDNDRDYVDTETGEVVTGLRKRGKSKENRPNPIVQMGMFMDMDGIPLAFVIFPGNESEQTSLQPLERVLDSKFGLTDFVVSTDAGLGSEENRRYNMAGGRDYICVQSLPSLKAADREMALAPKGWRIAYCHDDKRRGTLEENYLGDNGVFDLDTLREAARKHDREHAAEIRGGACRRLLQDVTFFREIIVDKEYKYPNPQWEKMEREHPGKKHTDADGKTVPRELKSVRPERVIVTYSHDFDLYLKHKRDERLRSAEKIVRNRQTKSRQSQQDPRRYVTTTYTTASGEKAAKVEMAIDHDAVNQEERFDGFYAYGTSLDDSAIEVLRARSFHHEIEHLFRTTKTFLDARPVYLSRQDRIKSHFLICFLSMVIVKILQRQLTAANPGAYRDNPLTIDSLIETLQNLRFGLLPGNNYIPMFKPSALMSQLQSLVGVEIDTQILTSIKMNKAYRHVNVG